MKYKKVLACILTILMMLVVQIQPETLNNQLILGNAAKSYTEITIDNIKYHVYSNYAEVFECDKNVEGSIVIPSNVNGIPITSIYYSSFHGCSKLKSVSLPDGVVTIGNNAFSECSELESINIPNSVTDIGNWAFRLCRNLSSIKVPDSVVNIGCQAFDKTAWLLEKQKENPLVIINNILIDGSTCKGDVIVPDSVTSICSRAFWECSGLTSISLPNSVTSIGDDAFWKCEKMTSIILPDSITNIGAGAFSSCSLLSSIALPEGILAINKNTFSYCRTLSSVKIPNSVTSIGFGAFMYCSELTSIIIPNVESLDENVFEYCKKLTIYGKKGSCVDNYAYKYDIPFEDISNLTSTITTTQMPTTTTTTSTTTMQKPTTTTTTTTTTTAITSKATNDKRYIGTWTAYAYSDYENAPKKDLSNESVSFTLYDDMTGIMFNFGGERKAELTWANESNDCITVNWKGDIASFNYSNDELVFKRINGKIYYFVKEYSLGDVNNDGQINAVDASSVLSYYAMISTNKDGGFNDNQIAAADVDHDGKINAVDASNILSYYAYVSTTKEEVFSMEQFMKKAT